eukprot:8371719-Pyramimonas_sp.AAC.1
MRSPGSAASVSSGHSSTLRRPLGPAHASMQAYTPAVAYFVRHGRELPQRLAMLFGKHLTSRWPVRCHRRRLVDASA